MEAKRETKKKQTVEEVDNTYAIHAEFQEGKRLFDYYARINVNGKGDDRRRLTQDKRQAFLIAKKALESVLAKADGEIKRGIVTFMRDRNIAPITEEYWLTEIEAKEATLKCKCINEPVAGHFARFNREYPCNRRYSPEKKTDVYTVFVDREITPHEQLDKKAEFKRNNNLPLLEEDLAPVKYLFYRREYVISEFDKHYEEC
jgi:hypothetical protein